MSGWAFWVRILDKRRQPVNPGFCIEFQKCIQRAYNVHKPDQIKFNSWRRMGALLCCAGLGLVGLGLGTW